MGSDRPRPVEPASSDAESADPASPATATGASGVKGFFARHKRAAGTLLLGAFVFGLAYYVLPQVVGLGATLERLRSGNPWWLGLGAALEAVSIAACVALFRAVFTAPDGRIGW